MWSLHISYTAQPEILAVLVVWPQTNHKKVMAEFKFGGGVSGLFVKERCRLSVEVLEQSHEFANLQEI